ncbi:hypothetical protein OJJOAM_000223 [Cupriavidus sp. H18C1]|uniref:alpha/beta fold hydrolase n=1 Tax=Cupriavidus sp. H18C1 TaxID=3241601 RepID=UPI003BB858AE
MLGRILSERAIRRNAPTAIAHARALNPRVRVSLYDNSGHAPFLEEPQRFNRDLAGFVSAANR